MHFDPPADFKDYTHRSGRTARAGAEGIVVSLVSPDQRGLTARFQRELGQRGGLDRPDVRRLGERVPDDAPRSRRAAGVRSATSTATDGRPSGTIKWFDARKGFGFIERERRAATCSCTSRPSRATATAASRRARSVEFEVAPGSKGEQARARAGARRRLTAPTVRSHQCDGPAARDPAPAGRAGAFFLVLGVVLLATDNVVFGVFAIVVAIVNATLIAVIVRKARGR